MFVHNRDGALFGDRCRRQHLEVWGSLNGENWSIGKSEQR